MADNLMQKSHKNSEKNKYNNVVHRTTSESLRLNESEKGSSHPTSLQPAHNPRKISSFQITSVTVGSRVSTDAGEDSADDLDESHTDEISRITDIENETPSYSEDTFSKDDVFYNASSASLGCAPVIPTSSQYGLAIVGQDTALAQPSGTLPNCHSSDVNDMHVSVTNAGSGSIINIIGNVKPQEGMKEIQEHVRNERFKVVKIESTEPFRRGRWICMDYLDHTTQPTAPLTLNNNLEVTESNTLQAPDSGVVINDCQLDDLSNDLTCKGPKEIQNTGIVQHLEQSVQKQYMPSPGQSLTQPLNVMQQQIPVNQSVSVQSPPLEIPQQMPNQNMQQMPQQHPQSMTHITMQTAPQNHPQQQQPQVQQMPQSFPQHQLQQVLAQTQGMAMQQIPMHQQIPQQMQQIPNQQMQQMSQHMPQQQIPNMQQMQQIPQMQAMANQGQMAQVGNQPAQMQQLQMQQIQNQQNAQQMHQMQQAQMTNMGQSHHLQSQQAMAPQQTHQTQLQHMPSQAQMQALQNQQMPNHIQQIQMQPQLAAGNQQMAPMQPQMHQIPTQPQQNVVPTMHPQMQQQGMSNVQPQYNQAVNQPQNAQAIMNASLPTSQQQGMVQQQHNVTQYHTQQSQMSQQGQTLPQEVLSSITTSQQGATLPSNLQSMANQPQGSTLPANLQSLSNQQQQTAVHAMAPQQGNVAQGNMQMMGPTPQNIQMSMDGNQPNMQMPGSETIYMQPTNVPQQIPVGQHIPQQNMMPQQVGGGGVQYVPSQPVPQQVSMAHQNIPMSMQQNMPVNMGGAVHANVVQSQTSMGLGYGGVVPVMSQSNVAPESAVSGTNSPVVPMPVNSTTYVGNAAQAGHENQGFSSPVSAVISNVNVCESGGQDVPADSSQAPDTNDGKDDTQGAPAAEDERYVVMNIYFNNVPLYLLLIYYLYA